jgi:hypothetical protein
MKEKKCGNLFLSLIKVFILTNVNILFSKQN